MLAWLKGLFGAISASISSPSTPPPDILPLPTNGPTLSTPKRQSLREEKATSEEKEITQNLLRELISAASRELEALEHGETPDIRAVSMVAMRLKPNLPQMPPRLRITPEPYQEKPDTMESPPSEVSPCKQEVPVVVSASPSITAKLTSSPMSSITLNPPSLQTGSKGSGQLQVNRKKSGVSSKGVILPPPQPIKAVGGMTWNPEKSKWEPTSKSAKARDNRLTASLSPVQKWEEIKKQQKRMKKNKHKMSTITVLNHTPMAEEKNGMRLNPDTMIWEKIEGDDSDPFEGLGWKADEMIQVRDGWNDVRKEFTVTIQLRNIWNKSYEKHMKLEGWLSKETDGDNRSFLDNARRLAIKKLISDAASYSQTPQYTGTPPLPDCSPRGMDFTVVTPRTGIPRRLRLSGVLQKDMSGYIRQEGELGRFTSSPPGHLRQESAGDPRSPKGYGSPHGYASPRQVASPRHLRELSDPGYRVTSPTSRQESGDVRLKDLAARINIRKKSRVSMTGLDSPRSYSPRRLDKSTANIDSPRSMFIDSPYSSDVAEDWTEDFAPSNQPMTLVHHRLQLWVDADDEESDYDDLVGGELLLRQEFRSRSSEKEKKQHFDISDDFSDFESPCVLVSDPKNKSSGGDNFLSKWADSDSEEDEVVPTTNTPPSAKIPVKFKPRDDLLQWMESDDDHIEFDFERKRINGDESPILRPKILLKWDSDTEEDYTATEETTSNLVSPVKLEKKENNKSKKKKSGDFSAWAESDSDSDSESDYGNNFTEDLALSTKLLGTGKKTLMETSTTSTQSSVAEGAEVIKADPAVPTFGPEVPPPEEYIGSRDNTPIGGEGTGSGYKQSLVTRYTGSSNNINPPTPKKLDSKNKESDDDEDSDYGEDFGGDIAQKIAAFTKHKVAVVNPDGNTGSSHSTLQGGMASSSSEEEASSGLQSPQDTLLPSYPSTIPEQFAGPVIPKTAKSPSQMSPDPLRDWVENGESDSEDFGRDCKTSSPHLKQGDKDNE